MPPSESPRRSATRSQARSSPPHRTKGQCERCDYRVVCGPYEELRSARKPQGNLEPLLAVRALP